MIDWHQVLVEIATRGGFTGLSYEEIISLMGDLYPSMIFDGVVMGKVWKKLVGFCETQVIEPGSKAVVGKAVTGDGFLLRIESESAWGWLMMGGREVKLTQSRISLLEAIGRAGPGGITCPDLGAQIKMDARNLHYHLQPLQNYSIILKIPVTVRKTNSYLCVLSRFVPEETLNAGAQGQPILAANEEQRCLVKPTNSQFMTRIGEVLQSAPDQIMSCVELFNLVVNEDSRNRALERLFRKCLRMMVKEGFVEMVLAHHLGGVIGTTVYRFKKSFQPSSLTEVLKSSKKGVSLKLRPMISHAKQARDLVAASGSSGMTLNEVKEALGIGTKVMFRLHKNLNERRLIGNSDVVKISEFAGKERRHRLFIEGSNSETDLNVDPPLAQIPSQVSQTSQASLVDSPGPKKNSRMDSITKSKREQLFMKHLLAQSPPVLEITTALGVHLGQELAKLFPSSASKGFTTVDKKTMTRMVGGLVEAGVVREVVVVLEVPRRQVRRLVIPVELEKDDPRLLAMIEGMKELPKMYDLTAADEDTDANDNESQHQQQQERQRPRISQWSPEEIKKRLFSYGFISGSMQRLRLLHLHLCSVIGPGHDFNTSTTLFASMPINLFRQIVGISSVSPELETYFAGNPTVGLDEMPRALRQEVVKKRGPRTRSVLRKMLSWLVQLGLLVVKDDALAKRLSFHIPIGFRVSPMGHLPRPPDGRTHRLVEFKSTIEIESYWAQLSSLWSCQVTTEEIPEVLKMATISTNWLMLPESRVVGANRDPGKRRLLMKRPINLNPPSRKIRTSKSNSTMWSSHELASLRLAFILLHHPPFPTHPTILPWLLASPLFPQKSKQDVRIHGTRLTWDWNSMKACLDLETKVNLFISINRETIQSCLEGNAGKEEKFVEYYGLVAVGLQTFERDIKEYFKPNAVGRRLYHQSSCLWADWDRQKHSRTSLMGHLDSLPFSQHPLDPPTSTLIDPSILSAMTVIKSLMTIESIETPQVASILSPFPHLILTSAMSYLHDSGFLGRGSRGKFRYRIPGCNFGITIRVAMLLVQPPEKILDNNGMELSEETVGNIDLDGLVDGMLLGSLKCNFTSIDQMSLTISIESTGKIDFLAFSDTDLEALLPTKGLTQRIWYSPLPPHSLNSTLLKNSLLHLLNLIKESPAIPLPSLRSKMWPIFDDQELAELVDVLTNCGWVSSQEIAHTTYLFPILN